MGFPKALLRYRDKTFIEGILEACSAAGLEPLVVVLGPDASRVLKSTDLRSAMEVRNTRPETGQIGSIQQGLTAIINHPVEAALVWPVDQPHVSIGTVQALLDEFRRGGSPIVIPVHGGRRGHPVLFGRPVFEELLGARQDLGARAVVRANQGRISEVPVADPAVLEDIDTPEAYEQLVRRSGPVGNS